MANLLDLKNPTPSVEPAPQERPSPRAPEQPMFTGMLPDEYTSEEFLEWEAHHPLPEHGRSKHYALMAGAVLAGGTVAYWQASWSTMLVMLLAAAAWELRERLAKPHAVRVDSRGLTVDTLHYPHARLMSFDIHRMPDGTTELSLATDHWHSPWLRLPLGNQDPQVVREMLAMYVPEESHKIPLLDWWLRTPKK